MSPKYLKVTHKQIVDAEADRVHNDVEAARRIIHEKADTPEKIVKDMLNRQDIDAAGTLLGKLSVEGNKFAIDYLRFAEGKAPSAAAEKPSRSALPPRRAGGGGRINPNTGRSRR
jgi:hypothetical protein